MWLPSLSDAGAFASIFSLVIGGVSLIVSVWVLVNTYRLKSEFKVFVGIPRLVNKIIDNEATLKKLSRKLDTSRHLISAELSKIEANVDSIKEKDPKAHAAIQRFQLTVREYRDSPASEEKLWDVHKRVARTDREDQ